MMMGSRVLSFCSYSSLMRLSSCSQLFLYSSNTLQNYCISPQYLVCMCLKDSINSSSTFTRLSVSCSVASSEGSFFCVLASFWRLRSSSCLSASISCAWACMASAIWFICSACCSALGFQLLNSSIDSVNSVLTLINSSSDSLSSEFSSSSSAILSRSSTISFSVVKLYSKFLDMILWGWLAGDQLIIFNNIPMGQRNSQALQDDGIALDSWIQAIEDPTHTLFPNVNPHRRRLLVNKDTEELIEEYELQFLSQEDFYSYSREVEMRKEDPSPRRIELISADNGPYRNSPYIYKVKYFTNTSVAELCSTVYNGLLYARKVELRLKEINDIPLPDQLYLYQCCLEGFKELYEKVGSFDITEEMIFFTQEGKVRVWMNPNLSKHHPNYCPAATATNVYSVEFMGSQSDMVKNLINLIEENTDSMADCPVHFREYLVEKGYIDRLSFGRTLEEFHRYVEYYRLTANPYMKSIYDLFHHEDEHESQSQKSNHRIPKKEYESLKNSSHELSFQKLNSSSHKHTPTRHNITPLDASRASKHSYNSEYNTRLLEPQPGKFPPHPKRSYKQYGESSQISVTNIPQLPNPFNKVTESKREIITFCPPERKVFQTEPLIAKYRSLQKTIPIVPAQPRPITFSYQNQQSVKYLQKPPNPQPKERKQSIIDKLNTPLHQTANTISESVPISTPVAPSAKINYFSSSEAFVLDKQIAEDMMKYLGFNPNLI